MEPLDKELHRIAVTAIIYKGNKFLITKRALHKKAHPGKWTVPGGGFSTDDYINHPQTHCNAGWYGAVEEALLREVKEESGISIKKPEYLLDLTFIRPDNIPVLVLSYFAEYQDGEVAMDEDTIDFAWVTKEEAKTYDLIPGILEEIDMVDAILKKRNS